MLKSFNTIDASSKFQLGDLVEINVNHQLTINQLSDEHGRRLQYVMKPDEVGIVLDSIFLEEDGVRFHVFVCLWNQEEIVCSGEFLRKKEQRVNLAT